MPAHVPPLLVHDFDICDPGGGRLDHYAALRQLHEIGVPDIFWTRYNGAAIGGFNVSVRSLPLVLGAV